jgi:hypothetical protein
MEFSEQSEHVAVDLMDSLLSEAGMAPGAEPVDDSLPGDYFQAAQDYDDGRSEIQKMKQAGLYHAEAFEL